MNIAILSTSNNAYSETFIQAHKKRLKGNVRYYYGSYSNLQLENEGPILSGMRRYVAKGVEKIKNVPRYAEAKALINSWKKNKIDVILAEYGTTAAIYLDAIQASGIPLVIHFHGYDATAYKTIEEFNKEYERMFAYASSVIVVSKVMYGKVLELGCPEHKLVKNTYGPNDLFFELKPKFSKPQFIAIGRFTDKKAPYYTILAFKKVLKLFPEAKLIMAGDGHLLNSCENLVGYFGMANSVEFVGVITPTEFCAYLEESLAFVQHSITAKSGDMEGTPLAVLESSAAGLPIISTFHAGIPDVIIHKETGLLVKEHDVEKMTAHMVKILSDKSYAKQMGAKGRENISKNFSMKKHIDKIDEILLKTKHS
jgi:glycosyltransferase involved in cell wall biosynthesis